MVILGDVAIPNKALSLIVSKALLEASFKKNQSVVFNLEGLLTEESVLNNKKPILYNHPSVKNIFKKFDVKIAALANNHTLDLPKYLHKTKNELKKNGFLTVGAGGFDEKDFSLVSFIEKDQTVYLLNACWEFLLYNQNTKNNNLTVNVINEQKIINQVLSIKKEDNNAKIVLYFHWNFDLEVLPFPSHRQFSKVLIDCGASLVIGGHSHCVQGGERYKDGYIVYGLGNFFLPNGIFANGNLNFPQMSNLGLVLEWDVKSNDLFCNWFEYSFTDNQHSIAYKSRDFFDTSFKLLKRSPYQNFNHEKYIVYFLKNRRKKKLIPVFKNFDNEMENKIKMVLLKSRAKIARRMAILGLIKWQN